MHLCLQGDLLLQAHIAMLGRLAQLRLSARAHVLSHPPGNCCLLGGANPPPPPLAGPAPPLLTPAAAPLTTPAQAKAVRAMPAGTCCWPAGASPPCRWWTSAWRMRTRWLRTAPTALGRRASPSSRVQLWAMCPSASCQTRAQITSSAASGGARPCRDSVVCSTLWC